MDIMPPSTKHSILGRFQLYFSIMMGDGCNYKTKGTVDGRNPAPSGIYKINACK